MKVIKRSIGLTAEVVRQLEGKAGQKKTMKVVKLKNPSLDVEPENNDKHLKENDTMFNWNFEDSMARLETKLDKIDHLMILGFIDEDLHDRIIDFVVLSWPALVGSNDTECEVVIETCRLEIQSAGQLDRVNQLMRY